MAEVKKTRSKTKKNSALDKMAIIELPQQLDISSSSAFHKKLQEIYLGESITFNASKVERITTAGIQILISTEITAKKRGGTILVTEPSDVFKTVISDLGFSNQLKEWMGSDV